MKYLDPKADLTFKRVFGEHPDLVISLLNALLPITEEEAITDEELARYKRFWDSISIEKTLYGSGWRKGVAEGKAEG